MRTAGLLLVVAMLLACHGSGALGQFGWPGYYGGYATTPGESYAMGMSALVSSAGMATLATSQAASNFEDAVSKDIDNRVKFAHAYNERMKFVQSYRESKRRPPPTSEQLYRWAQQGNPKPLSASELDPVTGDIAWPVVLRDETFRTYRESTQRFFHDAVSKPETFSYASYERLQQASSGCLKDLKSRIDEYRPNDYIHAKKFVASLTYAAQQM